MSAFRNPRWGRNPPQRFFFGREKVEVATLPPAASSPNKVTISGADICSPPSPLSRLFGQFAPLGTAAVSRLGSLFTWNFFKTSCTNLSSLCVLSGRPPRACAACRRAQPWAQTGPRQAGRGLDPWLHLPRLLLLQIELWPALLASLLRGPPKCPVLSRRKPRAGWGTGMWVIQGTG